ncbi:MAG: cbb3-type cytochrome c oxidase subunit [Verrucomicrobiaceae bacterium]|nr:cbb3-type cytochrome c oxidase subunit [Verrucomicrobiaceae bacterium]
MPRAFSFLPAIVALALALLFTTAPAAFAHPLQAEPIDHPYVFTFDQFHIAEDPDETLVDGGLLLMAETNCIACHQAAAPWQQQLAPRPGPNLAGVGSRLDADTLWLMVRSPQHRKKGTLMPGLFSGGETDPEKVEALTQYLLTLKQPVEPLPPGSADNGKKLYHTVGCVACHEPATDYRPPTTAKDANVDRPGNGSNPLALADAYDVQALGRFLLNPHDFRPAGRMPDLHLSFQEAADIAAYLHIGRTAEKAVERAALKIAPQTAAAGRALFVEQRCTVCHSTGETMEKHGAKPLDQLRGQGCIAEKPTAGTPRFDFNPLQRRALTLALKHVQHHGPVAMNAHQKIDWQMLRLNCYACHERGSKGGPEDARAQYFMAADSGAESLGDFGRFPPSLDKAGWKLTTAWLQRVLYGEGGSVRPYLSVRMPNFGKANTEALPALLAEADKPENPPFMDTSGLAKHHRAEGGRKMMGITGLGCVTCHGLKDRKSLGVPVINLSHTVERLNPSYFKALLLNPQVTQPGTLMPPLFMARKTADQDIEQIWTYLKELDQQPLPEGLLHNDDYELKPEKEGRPVVFRTFMEGVGTHAISVGYPQGVNAAFDALHMRWALLWKGRFVDAFGTWQDRSMPPAKPLGTSLLKLSKEVAFTNAGTVPEPEFKGYKLDKQGLPTMRYTVGGLDIEDRLQPTATGFEHIVTVQGQGMDEWTFTGLAKDARSVKLVPDARGVAVLRESVVW